MNKREKKEFLFNQLESYMINYDSHMSDDEKAIIESADNRLCFVVANYEVTIDRETLDFTDTYNGKLFASLEEIIASVLQVDRIGYDGKWFLALDGEHIIWFEDLKEWYNQDTSASETFNNEAEALTNFKKYFIEFGQVIKSVCGWFIFAKKESEDVFLCWDYDAHHHLYSVDTSNIEEVTDEFIKTVGKVL